jgi:hypothetical protein
MLALGIAEFLPWKLCFTDMGMNGKIVSSGFKSDLKCETGSRLYLT